MRRSTSRASNERFKADRSGTEEWWCLPDRGSRSRGSGRADTGPRRANDRRPAAARHHDDLRPRPESGPRDGIGTHPERIERCPREFHDPAGNRIRRSDFQTGLRIPVPERVLDGGGRFRQTQPPSGEAVRRRGLLPRERTGDRRDGRGHRRGCEREPPSVLRVWAGACNLGGGNQQARADPRGRPEAPPGDRAAARGPADEALGRPGKPYRQAHHLRTGAAARTNHPRARRRAAGILKAPGAPVPGDTAQRNSARRSSGSWTPSGCRTGGPFFSAGSRSSYVGTSSVR